MQGRRSGTKEGGLSDLGDQWGEEIRKTFWNKQTEGEGGGGEGKRGNEESCGQIKETQ